MNNFTMTEYIEMKKLNVSPHDPTATRIIGTHLRTKGYRTRRVKRDGKFQLIWTTDPVPNYDDLRSKLND